MVRGLEAEFGPFELDPACTAETAKAPRFYTPAEDGLRQPWAPRRVFLNPPFSSMAAWIRKAVDEADAGATVVCLTPVRTEMDWWHDLVIPNAEVRFLRGRPRFVGPDGRDNGRPWFALAIRTPGKKAHVERLASKLTPLLAVLVFALSAWHARVGYGDALVLPLRGSALALLFGAFIASVTAEGQPSATKRALRSRWLRVLGKYSYGLYVFHGIVAYFSHEHRWEERWTKALGSHAAAVALVVVVGCGLSFAIAFASFELFERPVLKLKRIFEYRDSSAAVPIRERDQVHRAKI